MGLLAAAALITRRDVNGVRAERVQWNVVRLPIKVYGALKTAGSSFATIVYLTNGEEDTLREYPCNQLTATTTTASAVCSVNLLVTVIRFQCRF